MTSDVFYLPALRRLRRVVRVDTGVNKLTATETMRVELCARLAARLEQLRAELEEQPLIVRGSRGQPVANGLLMEESRLADQLDRQLARLVLDVRNRAMVDEARALTAASR